jgi:hypothetical protein
MNKPGGTAWILSCRTHEPDLLTGTKAGVSYDVKYVLHGQSDRDVPDVFVVPFLELERKSRKRGIETVLPMSSPIPQKKEKRVKTPKEHSHNKSEEVSRDDMKVECAEQLLISRNEVPNNGGQGSANKKTDSSANKKTKRESISSNAKHGTVKKNICISHTSLEMTDFAKLERFLTYFSSSIGVECPPTNPSSSSSSSSSFSSTLVPVLNVSPKIPHCVGTTVAIDIPSLRLSDKFDTSVTHLIVSTDKKGVLRKRTLKFMQAIMGKMNSSCG